MLVAFLGALALAFSAVPAAAQTPCWRQIINDWVDNDRIDDTYPLHCYGDAIKHIPADLAQYTSIIEDITAARQQLIRSRNTKEPVRTIQSRNTKGTTKPNAKPQKAAPKPAEPPRGLFTEGFDKVGPRNADSVPLPLLIMGGLALLLIAAGAAGVVSRRLRARRLPAP